MAKRLTDNERAVRAILEKQWQATVVLHARMAGWMVHFIPDNFHKRAKEEHDYTKQGDKGYPDLTLISPDGHVMFVELKRVIGYLSEEQEAWRDRVISGGNEWHLWRPDQLDDVVIPRLYGGRLWQPPTNEGDLNPSGQSESTASFTLDSSPRNNEVKTRARKRSTQGSNGRESTESR